jgi:Spy/CpxP family protein refolding chaperone
MLINTSLTFKQEKKMSRSKLITLVSLILLVTIGVAVAIAQSHKSGGGTHGNDKSADDHHAKLIKHFTEELGLSAEQKTKVEQIVAESAPRFNDIHARMAAAHKESMESGTNGVYDEARAQAAASRQADIVKQGFLEFEKMKAAIFATLTEEQRGKAKKIFGEMAANFGH